MSFVREKTMPVAQAIIGGVLGMLQSFLEVVETMESHRSAGLSWSKLGRNNTWLAGPCQHDSTVRRLAMRERVHGSDYIRAHSFALL